VSGDTQAPGEKLWYASEYGYRWRQIGPTRTLYARDREHAEQQFIAAGYKQLQRSRLDVKPAIGESAGTR
jgi:hypothetical protein